MAAPKSHRGQRYTAKDWVEISQSIFTMTAILAGGVWFYYSGTHFSRLNIGQEVVERQIDDNLRWVQVNISLDNVGETRFTFGNLTVRIQQILPLHETARTAIREGKPLVNEKYNHVFWPYLGEHKKLVNGYLEPKESQPIIVEFVIPSEIRTFMVYTSVENSDDPRYGRQRYSVHDVSASGAAGRAPGERRANL